MYQMTMVTLKLLFYIHDSPWVNSNHLDYTKLANFEKKAQNLLYHSFTNLVSRSK